MAPCNTPKDEYDLAYGYVLRKDYALAEEGLRAFLKNHPNDRLVADANYWLGESLFQRQRYREAAESFLTVSTKFETAGRAPDSLLRLGQSLAALKEKRSRLRDARRNPAQISEGAREREAGGRAGTEACRLRLRPPLRLPKRPRCSPIFPKLPSSFSRCPAGPDSTALLWLAARWRARRKRGPKLIAVTVDHGLRAESAREARAVKRLARETQGRAPHAALDRQETEDRHSGGRARGALPPARRRGAQGRRAAHPHGAHARRSGRDGAVPAGAGERVAGLARDGARLVDFLPAQAAETG